MKKLFIIGMLFTLLIPFGVYATVEQPDKPVCPSGTTETVPAQWMAPVTHEITVVDEEAWDEVVPPVTHIVHHDAITHQEYVPGIPAVTHIEHRCKKLFGGWHSWQNGKCPSCGCWFGCQERTVIDVPAVPGYWITVVDQEAWDEVIVDEEGYTIHHEAITHQETVVDEEGYWIAPVCGEQCARCSNIKPFTYVEWFDRDGGCDGDWYNERVEYPDDDRCGYVPPEPEPTPIPTPELEEEVILPEPLFMMWLLTRSGRNGDQLCMIISETHPSVERQQALCGWVATNAPCADYVYDDDTWSCDEFGGLRLPLYSNPSRDLMDVWNIHLSRDQ